METLLILNPNANKGNALKVLPQIEQTLKNLGIPFKLQKTQSAGQANKLAYQAALNNYTKVIAIGGDGTCNEVLNGLFSALQEGYQSTFGVIPTGSGNDFAYALGIHPNISEACQLLKTETVRLVDIGKVTVDGNTRFFTNNVGLGFDGEVLIRSQQKKRFQGFFMYLWSVLKTIAFGQWPYPMIITFNNHQIKQSITLITVANGVRSGGGFLLTPNAKIDDGLLDVCYAKALSKWGAINILPKTFNGSHIHHRDVTLATCTTISIFVPEGVPAHIDGELLCKKGYQFNFEILPKYLKVIAKDKTNG